MFPFTVSEGYFTGKILPAELGFRANDDKSFERVRQDGGQSLHYCEPVGTHPSMTAALLARAAAPVPTAGSAAVE